MERCGQTAIRGFTVKIRVDAVSLSITREYGHEWLSGMRTWASMAKWYESMGMNGEVL